MFTSTVVLTAVALAPYNTTESTRLDPVPLELQQPRTLHATFKSLGTHLQHKVSSNRGDCETNPVALTDSDFGDGAYILQAGFAEGESFGATYDVPAEQFPIKIDVMEALFATSNATQETTTEWSVTVWDGTPADGLPVASFASDDIILPHLVMPPGSNGIIISVSVDSEDPDQIWVYNESGSNSFSVSFRVEQHNQSGNPCITSPPTSSNAFPCTDTSGLQYPNENWIEAISGSFCICGSGWMTFQQFPSICTPSGDWVMRSAYTPANCSVEPAACCFDEGNCQDLSPNDCLIFGGEPSSAGTSCATYECGTGQGACCVESTGNCVDFDLNTCLIVGGEHLGEGTNCSSVVCFPEGACCLEEGDCIGPVAETDCIAVGGTFQGDATSCSMTSCPQPVGACCGSAWCLELSEVDCSAVGGEWEGAGTLCNVDSACQEECDEDLNNDGYINVNDLLAVVGDWGSTNSNADIDGSGAVDTSDLLAVIGAWGQCE